jgi:hypothetical protein
MRGDVHVSLSQLERHFLRLLRETGLPLPHTNRLAGRPASRLPLAGPRPDRRGQRERAARARKDRLERYTWADVVERPAQTERDLRRLLGAG